MMVRSTVRTLMWCALVLALTAIGAQAFAGGLVVSADRVTSPDTTLQVIVPEAQPCPVDHRPVAEPGELALFNGQPCLVVAP